MTCFHLAVRQGHTDLIKLLLKTEQFDINEKVSRKKLAPNILRGSTWHSQCAPQYLCMGYPWGLKGFLVLLP